MDVESALAIVDRILHPTRLNQVQELVFRHSWAGKTYPELAASSHYDQEYIRDVGFRLWRLLSQVLGEKVTKNNVQAVLRQRAQQIQAEGSGRGVGETNQTFPHHPSPKLALAINPHQDWGEAIDVSVFYGRSEELATLRQWIVKDRCRLVAVLGMGGIGKTALTVKLAEQVQDQFEYLI